MAETFAVGDSGCDDRMKAAVLVRSGGQAPAQKRGQNVIFLFFVGREQAIFHEEGNVAESIVDAGRIVRQVGWKIEDDFDALEGNEFESLAAVVIVGRDACGVYLPELVIAKFFFEARRGGGDGSNPVRLLGLRLVDTGKPVGEVAFLGAGSRSGR